MVPVDPHRENRIREERGGAHPGGPGRITKRAGIHGPIEETYKADCGKSFASTDRSSFPPFNVVRPAGRRWGTTRGGGRELRLRTGGSLVGAVNSGGNRLAPPSPLATRCMFGRMCWTFPRVFTPDHSFCWSDDNDSWIGKIRREPWRRRGYIFRFFF